MATRQDLITQSINKIKSIAAGAVRGALNVGQSFSPLNPQNVIQQKVINPTMQTTKELFTPTNQLSQQQQNKYKVFQQKTFSMPTTLGATQFLNNFPQVRQKLEQVKVPLVSFKGVAPRTLDVGKFVSSQFQEDPKITQMRTKLSQGVPLTPQEEKFAKEKRQSDILAMAMQVSGGISKAGKVKLKYRTNNNLAQKIDEEITGGVKPIETISVMKVQGGKEKLIAQLPKATEVVEGVPANSRLKRLQQVIPDKYKTPEAEMQIKQRTVQQAKSFRDIIQQEPIDVKQKVNLLDYLRTPERVLNKIGLGKQATEIRGAYDKYLEELPVEISKITEWSRQVPKESNPRIFQYLDGQGVQLNPQELKVAGEIKSYLETWADKLQLPKDRRITSYITHIFDKDFIKKEFDPDLAKLIENRVAGSVYDPFTEQRLGALGYKQDTWAALDAYVKRATRKVNMDPALSNIKEASANLEQSQYKYVKRYIDRVNMRPTEIDNLLDNTIKSIVGYRYGMRPVAELTRKARQVIFRGTLGLNVGSALKNLSQGANTYAKLGEKYTINGYAKIFKNILSGDDELQRVGVLRDEFIQDRTINATKKVWEKFDKGLFSLFEFAEKINRGAAYFGAKAKGLAEGMDEASAIEFGKKTVRDTQFTFGSVDTPPILSSDLAKLFGQFQSFSLKQAEFLGGMAKKKDFAGLLRYTGASLAFVFTVGKLFGMKPEEIIPSFRFGAPPVLDVPIKMATPWITGKDQYGNELDTKQKINRSVSAGAPLIPAGVQLKKTIGGLQDVSKGYSETEKGRIKYPVEQSTSNAVRGGLFGNYNLPEAKNYKEAKDSALSENQSSLIKQDMPNRFQTYADIMAKRDQNAIENKAKEQVKQSGAVQETADNVYYKNEKGEFKTFNKNFDTTKPALTGSASLDSQILSKYQSAITARVNAVVDFYKSGGMTAEEANKQIQELEAIKQQASDAVKLVNKYKVKLTGTSQKKSKMMALKSVKVKKISLPKVKKIKVKKIPKVKLSWTKLKPKKVKMKT